MIRLAQERGAAVVLIAVPSPGITRSAEPFYLEIATEKGATVRIAMPSLGIALSPEPLYREIAVEMGLLLEEKALTAILTMVPSVRPYPSQRGGVPPAGRVDCIPPEERRCGKVSPSSLSAPPWKVTKNTFRNRGRGRNGFVTDAYPPPPLGMPSTLRR